MTDIRTGGGNRRALQVAPIRKDGWTKIARRKFLATLAETCNVRLSAEAADRTPTNAYALRKRDAEFAGLWAEALAIGYERLEEALLRHALSAVNAIAVGEYSDEIMEEGEPSPRAPRVGTGLRPDRLGTGEVQVALAILNRHRASVEGRRSAMRGKRRATPEETDAALRRQLDKLALRIARDEKRAAATGSRDHASAVVESGAAENGAAESRAAEGGEVDRGGAA